MQVLSSPAVKLQPTECMDTPNTYDVLNISLYSKLCTVLCTVMYAKLYPCVQVASWEDLFPLERPSPCLLYIVPNTTVYFLLKDILYTVLYTTLYSVHCTVHYIVQCALYCKLKVKLYSTHNQSGWLSWPNHWGTLSFMHLVYCC